MKYGLQQAFVAQYNCRFVFFLRQILLQSNMEQFEGANLNTTYAEDSVKYATIAVAVAPIMAVYPFLQKYFVKGVMIGSVKG